MTDTSTGLSVTPELLVEINKQVDEIDAQLAAAGGESPGKTKIRNQWMKGNTITVDGEEVSETEKFVNDIVAQVLSAVNNREPEFKAGVYFGLNKVLNAKDNAWKEEAEKLLESAVPETTDGSAETVSVDELRSLREKKNALVDQFGAIKNILVMMRPDLEDQLEAIPVPEKSRGALPGTKKGPRKLSQMIFSVNGEQVAPDKNSMSGLAELTNFDGGARPFRQALDAALKTLPVEEGQKAKSAADPGDSFEVVINGYTISGVKLASQDEDDEDEEETE